MKNEILKSIAEKMQFNHNLHTAKKALNFMFAFTLLFFVSCEENTLEPDNRSHNIVPKDFAVDIPESISSSATLKSGQVDTLEGEDIYGHLRTFIHIGDFGAELTQEIMRGIAENNFSRPLEVTILSDDDNRPKELVIIENAMFEGTQWEYKLTYTDVGDNPTGEGNIAMQVFWNLDPVEGIAMINPYNIDRNTEEMYKNTNIRIKYSEAGDISFENFDKYMIVSIDEWPMPNPLVDPYGLSKLKMFVGEKDNIVSIYGNSEHPNARFFNEETGFDWAFVAAASKTQDIAVAEVGLPPIDLDANERNILLGDYSVRNVIEGQILDVWPNIAQETLDSYLYHTQAPAFFNSNGFLQAGTAPSSDYDVLLEKIEILAPYNPYSILTMEIEFDE